MNKRLFVIAIERTKETSIKDIEDMSELLELLSQRYHFKWSQTANPEWVRALANEMETKQSDDKNEKLL